MPLKNLLFRTCPFLVYGALGMMLGVYLQLDSPPEYKQVSLSIEIKQVHKPLIMSTSPANRQCSHRTNLRFVFLILSTANHNGTLKREAVRHYWERYKNLRRVKVTIKFLLGIKELPDNLLKELETENSLHGDLLMLDHKDTYGYQVTEKLLLAIEWANTNLKYDFLVKADDDVVIIFDRFVKKLRSFGCPRNLYWAYMHMGAPVRVKGKWTETNWNFCKKYTNYAAGFAYLLSREVVFMVMKHRDKLLHLNNEDTSVGLWLVPYDVKFKHDWAFNCYPTCKRHSYVVHEVDVVHLSKAAKNVRKKGKLC